MSILRNKAKLYQKILDLERMLDEIESSKGFCDKEYPREDVDLEAMKTLVTSGYRLCHADDFSDARTFIGNAQNAGIKAIYLIDKHWTEIEEKENIKKVCCLKSFFRDRLDIDLLKILNNINNPEPNKFSALQKRASFAEEVKSIEYDRYLDDSSDPNDSSTYPLILEGTEKNLELNRNSPINKKNYSENRRTDPTAASFIVNCISTCNSLFFRCLAFVAAVFSIQNITNALYNVSKIFNQAVIHRHPASVLPATR